MKYVFGLFVILLSFLMGCTSEGTSSGEDCKMGRPAPMFSDTMRFVAQHRFEAEGQKGIEAVKLKNGLDLEILQTGCNDLMQEFRIKQKGDYQYKDDRFWIQGASQSMALLSVTSPNLAGLNQWAMTIANFESSMKLAEPFEPEPGIAVTVDKILGKEQATLIIRLEQK